MEYIDFLNVQDFPFHFCKFDVRIAKYKNGILKSVHSILDRNNRRFVTLYFIRCSKTNKERDIESDIEHLGPGRGRKLLLQQLDSQNLRQFPYFLLFTILLLDNQLEVR